MQTAPVTLAQSNDLSAPNGTDSTIRIFWSLMSIHVAIYLTVCLVTQPNMPLDMVEMLFWGQQWQLGYHKHPPLPAWITAAAWGIGGHGLLYFVSQLTVVVTFWAVWQFAREKLSPQAALCSVFVLQGCYYCTYMINDINNTIITRPFWALAILFLYRAIVRERPSKRNTYWALAGVAIGLGMLSKYYIGILVIAMMVLPLVSSQARQQLKTAGPWITTAVASLLFLPHFVWMYQNDFITLQYVLNRSGESVDYAWSNHFKAPLDFLVKQLPAVIPVFVLATPLILNRDPENSQQPLSRSDFFHRYLVVVFAGPILIYLLLGFTTGSTIRSMWGGPLFSFLGVLLFAFFTMPKDKKKVNKILRDSVCLGAVMVIALAGRNLLGPSMRGKLSKVHYPGQEIASQVNEKWNQQYAYPLPVVCGKLFVPGCVGVYSNTKVDVYGSMSDQASPWLNVELIQERGGVIVWEIQNDSEEPPAGWLERFEKVETLDSVVAFSRTFGESKPIKIGIAVVHPTRPELAALQRPSLEMVGERIVEVPDGNLFR